MSSLGLSYSPTMPSSDSKHPTRKQTVTQYLIELSEGRLEAADRLMPLIYDELLALAHDKLRFERPGHTLNTTALVHEAYFRMVEQRRVHWQSRTHFFAIAAQAMRRILINYAEKRNAAKRGGGAPRMPIHEVLDEALPDFSDKQAEELLALHEALTRMETFNERGCRVVEYRFFGGLTHQEIADMMGLSVSTVERSWAVARKWLRRELRQRD